MNEIIIIARQNLLEFSRDKIIHVIVGLLLVFLFLTQAISDLALSQKSYVILSLGTLGLELSGLFVVLMTALGLRQEIKRRTLLSILTKPISRTQFLLGKFLAILLLILLVFILGYFMLASVLFMQSLPIPDGLLPTLWVLGLEIAMMAALALLCSIWTSPGLSIFFVLGFWACGKMSYDLLSQAEITAKFSDSSSWLVSVAKVIYWSFPDLSKFDLTSQLVRTGITFQGDLLSPLLVAGGFIGLFMSIALWFFNQKDFS